MKNNIAAQIGILIAIAIIAILVVVFLSARSPASDLSDSAAQIQQNTKTNTNTY